MQTLIGHHDAVLCMDRAYTEKVIEETHGSWKKAEEKLRELAAPK